MSDLICGGFALIVVLAALVIYRRSFRRGYWDQEKAPLVFDLDDPADEYEYRCTIEQRRWGRERGPRIITKGKLQ